MFQDLFCIWSNDIAEGLQSIISLWAAEKGLCQSGQQL